MILDATQLKEVVSYLKTFQKLSQTAQEELLDHLCCDVEDTMETGLSFAEAFARCRDRWNENEVKKIHSSTQNRFTMVKVISVLFISVSALTFLSLPNTSGNYASVATGFSDDIEPEVNLLTAEPPSYCPLATTYKLTAPFGQVQHPVTKTKKLHQGIDWSAPLGTVVHAAGAGVVVEAGMKNHYGNCIIIAHDEVYQTLYAHLQTIDIAVGDTVAAGQRIGLVGSTGSSTGPHLHYEVIKDGVKVDPADYLP